MFSWKLKLLFFISSIFMNRNLSLPTVSDQCRIFETDWRVRREQSAPVLNRILDELVKQANCTQQRFFLTKCQEQKVTPKGLKVNVPKGTMTRDQELRFKKKCELELLCKTASRLYNKQHNSDERIAR